MSKSQYIVASAGTGKTEALATQIENLIINDKVDISQIALITFTNRATKEMRERLRDKLYEKWENGCDIRDQIDKINMAKISTIHIFCDEIIREYGLLMGISPNYKITSFSYETNAIIDDVIEENYNSEICEQIPTYRIKDLLKSFYNEVKDKGYVVNSKYQRKTNEFWDAFREYFFKLYSLIDSKVEQAKREQNILTTNDLLHYASKLIADKSVTEKVTQKIRYLFVDECQDINHEQMRLFATLMDYITVVIVGDAKQSIYAFRGSDKVAFETLIEKMQTQGATKSVADINYRSNDALVEIFNKIFESKFYFKKTQLKFSNIPLKSSERSAKEKSVFEFNFGTPIDDIIKKMAVKLENGENACYNEIAILCRTNREVGAVVNTLKSKGINAEVYSSKSIYKSKSIIDLYKVLKYLITDSEIEKHELFYTDYYLASAKFFKEKYLLEMAEGLKFEIKKESLSYIINRLIEISRINEYYTIIGKEQYEANLNRVKEIVRDLSNQGMSTIEIVDYLNIMIETQQTEQEPETVSKSRIIVSTIHTFKGLSADAVVLYGADKNLFRENGSPYEFDEEKQEIYFNKNVVIPNNTIIGDDVGFKDISQQRLLEYLEEELRLLYVACTRAREKLIIHNSNSESRLKYIREMNKNYISYSRWIKETKL